MHFSIAKLAVCLTLALSIGCTGGNNAGEQRSASSGGNMISGPKDIRDNSADGNLRRRKHDFEPVNDSWYRPPRDLSRFRWTKRLPDSDLAEVTVELRAEAEVLLRDVACVETSDDRADELVGREVPKRVGAKFFLVRAVCLNRGTGRFAAYLVENELLVEHGSLGHSAPPMERQPLVICLARKPDTVYVSYSMAQ